MQVRKVWSIGYQAPSIDVLAIAVNGRQVRAYCQNAEPVSISGYERVARDIQRLSPPLKCLDGRRNILGATDFRYGGLKAKRPSRRPDLADIQPHGGIIDIGHDCQVAKVGNNLTQELDTLASKIGCLIGQTGNIATRPCQTAD